MGHLGKSVAPTDVDWAQSTGLCILLHMQMPRSQDSSNTGWRNQSFRGYADFMQTQASSGASFDLSQGLRSHCLL